MERINLYDSFNLGSALAELSRSIARNEDLIPGNVVYVFWRAKQCMDSLLGESPLPLGVSKASAEDLSRQLTKLFSEYFSEPPALNSPAIPFWKLSLLQSALERFQTVFAEEMRELATYCVPRRGIFHTPALVDAADECFPRDLLPHIPEKARVEWRAAGRCLAFNLLSASGFHVARAVEGVMEAYFQLFSNQPGKTLKTWGDYLEDLEKLRNSGNAPAPDSKTLAEFKQMKDDYRNPIMHPRVVLTEGDTKMLFNNGESLIIAMAQEIAKIQANAQPSLALIPATGTN